VFENCKKQGVAGARKCQKLEVQILFSGIKRAQYQFSSDNPEKKVILAVGN